MQLRLALGAREPVQRALLVAEDHRRADHGGRAETVKHQRFGGPDHVAGRGLPRCRPVRGVGAEYQLGVAADCVVAAHRLGPGDLAVLGVDAANRRLEGARTDEIAAAQHRADQVGQSLDLVGAARRADRHFPAHHRGDRVDGRQARPLPDQQRVLERGDDARVVQRQRFARPLQLPDPAAVLGVEDLHVAVDAEHEDALAGDQWRRRDAHAQRLAPFDRTGLEKHELAVAGDDGREPAIAADAGRDLAVERHAPERLAGLRLHRQQIAVARGGGDGAAVDGHRHRKRHRADALVPHLLDADRRRDRLERLRLGLVGAEQRNPEPGRERRAEAQRDQDRAASPRPACVPGARRKAPAPLHFVAAALLAGAAAEVVVPSTLSLASTTRR